MTETKTIRAIITKYALSSGITVVDAQDCGGSSEGMISHRQKGGYTTYYHKSDWTTDPSEAVRRAETARTKKIAALEKQIAKLRKLKFEVPDDA